MNTNHQANSEPEKETNEVEETVSLENLVTSVGEELLKEETEELPEEFKNIEPLEYIEPDHSDGAYFAGTNVPTSTYVSEEFHPIKFYPVDDHDEVILPIEDSPEEEPKIDNGPIIEQLEAGILDIKVKLAETKEMHSEGLISDDEFEQRKTYYSNYLKAVEERLAEIKGEETPAEEEQVETAPAVPHDGKTCSDLVEEIKQFYDLLDIPVMGRNFESMDEVALRDHLYLLKVNHGGSYSMAELIQQTEIEYDRYLKSDMLKMRMSLIEQKSADTVSAMQKLRQVLGSDFIIGGVRTTEYHDMLKSAVAYVSTLHDKISQIGGLLGLRVPMNDFNKTIDYIPVVEGMPADPRYNLYVLNAIMAHFDKLFMQMEASNGQAVRSEAKIRGLEVRLEHLSKQLEAAQEHARGMSAAYEKFTAKSSFWVIRDKDTGGLLQAINPDEPVKRTRDIDLNGDYDTMMVFPARSGAIMWRDRLSETRKFRFNNLAVCRVSIVEEA